MKNVILLDENQTCFDSRRSNTTDNVIGSPIYNQTLDYILNKVSEWMKPFEGREEEVEIEVDSHIPYDGTSCISDSPKTSGERLVDILNGRGFRARVIECGV